MEIKLPPLYWIKKENGNECKQLLVEEQIINFEDINEERGFSFIEIANKTICFVTNRKNIPNNYDYVLDTDKKLTETNLDNIKLKSWLKHPKNIDHQPQSILNSWKNKFNFIEEDTENDIQGLRVPQVSALYSILSHLKISDEVCTVVMPTGTGKTETMLSVLTSERCKKLLITVPSDALRTQIAEKFIKLGLLKQFNILDSSCLNPKVALINKHIDLESFINLIDEVNVVVTTMNILSKFKSNELKTISTKISHCFIDEAHHTPAQSWAKIPTNFENTKIVQFTATPFRNDGKKLMGKIIFNFSLKQAQEQGYFKPINFIAVREYDLTKGDKLIAEQAVSKLREDINNGYNHILMARCETKGKAEDIFKIYQMYEEFNPILVHSSIANKKQIIKSIVNLEHRIIVAVNMLGEGFDLPQLKISALHDVRKSLPITLQFIGRFTRTKMDEELGSACCIANIVDTKVEDALSELYARDSDWNSLLARFSSQAVSEQIDLQEFISNFDNVEDSQIPFQNIRFPLSTMVYKNDFDVNDIDLNSYNTVFLNRFSDGIDGYEKAEHKFSYYNEVDKVQVIITANLNNIDWVNFKDIYGLHWRLLVIHYLEDKKLLFIHDSDNSPSFDKLANSVLIKPKQIKDMNVFRVLSDIKRLKLQNVGLKEVLNKNVRFTMRSGSDIEEALSDAVLRKTQKSFVNGMGYLNGDMVTIGCSYKGRVWSKQRGNLKNFTEWCKWVSNTIDDDTIDPNQILKSTVIPRYVTELPNEIAIAMDWHENIYNKSDFSIQLEIDNQRVEFCECSIEIKNTNHNDNEIIFYISNPIFSLEFKKTITTKQHENKPIPHFVISQLTNKDINLIVAGRRFNLIDYLNKYPPRIWFADGSSLEGNDYVKIEQLVEPYNISKLKTWNWEGVDLSKEAQGVDPIHTDSIQYKMINDLQNSDVDIIFDDDGSGETADIVTIKENDECIYIHLYHLKYAKGGKIGKGIGNFYEVCGQAQKSIKWKHKKPSEFFERLCHREIKKKNGNERSRVEKGTIEDIEKLITIGNRKPVKYEVSIVQPSLSKQNTSDDILTLLGVTENYLKEVANINLNVIISP